MGVPAGSSKDKMLTGTWREKTVLMMFKREKDPLGNGLEATYVALSQITGLHFVHALNGHACTFE
jgi:hypothetical protein